MAYPRKYPAAGWQVDDKDYNAIVDFCNGATATGTIAYPVSFTVRIVGGFYEAVNSVGVIVYGGFPTHGGVDGTNPSAVIQACIDALTSGGEIRIKAGTYPLPTTLTIFKKNNITIKGEGSGCNFRSEVTADFAMTTLLIPLTPAPTQLIYIDRSYNIKILNMAFEGNSWIATAINCYDVHMLDISDNYFRGFINNFIALYSITATKYTAQNWIMKNTFSLETVGCVGIALQGSLTGLHSTEDTIIFSNWFFSEWTDRGYGVWFADPVGGIGSGFGWIDSIRVVHNGFYFLEKAIVINGDDGSIVDNNNFEGNTEDIVLSGGYNIKTHFWNNKNTDFTTPLVVTNGATAFTGEFVNNTGFRIEHHTASDTLKIVESGTIHTNLGAGGAITLTLPQDATIGCTFEFVVMTAQALRIDPGPVGAIYINGAKQTDDKYQWADDEGESVKLVADGNRDWIAIGTVGTWTSE